MGNKIAPLRKLAGSMEEQMSGTVDGEQAETAPRSVSRPEANYSEAITVLAPQSTLVSQANTPFNETPAARFIERWMLEASEKNLPQNLIHGDLQCLDQSAGSYYRHEDNDLINLNSPTHKPPTFEAQKRVISDAEPIILVFHTKYLLPDSLGKIGSQTVDSESIEDLVAFLHSSVKENTVTEIAPAVLHSAWDEQAATDEVNDTNPTSLNTEISETLQTKDTAPETAQVLGVNMERSNTVSGCSGKGEKTRAPSKTSKILGRLKQFTSLRRHKRSAAERLLVENAFK